VGLKKHAVEIELVSLSLIKFYAINSNKFA